ncbi:unnamed protein product [Pedinophyceae sp. YPF-701]|nr:unnamed protein product [Pedinophyceae sp. YPF-701]
MEGPANPPGAPAQLVAPGAGGVLGMPGAGAPKSDLERQLAHLAMGSALMGPMWQLLASGDRDKLGKAAAVVSGGLLQGPAPGPEGDSGNGPERKVAGQEAMEGPGDVEGRAQQVVTPPPAGGAAGFAQAMMRSILGDSSNTETDHAEGAGAGEPAAGKTPGESPVATPPPPGATSTPPAPTLPGTAPASAIPGGTLAVAALGGLPQSSSWYNLASGALPPGMHRSSSLKSLQQSSSVMSLGQLMASMADQEAGSSAMAAAVAAAGGNSEQVGLTPAAAMAAAAAAATEGSPSTSAAAVATPPSGAGRRAHVGMRRSGSKTSLHRLSRATGVRGGVPNAATPGADDEGAPNPAQAAAGAAPTGGNVVGGTSPGEAAESNAAALERVEANGDAKVKEEDVQGDGNKSGGEDAAAGCSPAEKPMQAHGAVPVLMAGTGANGT